MAGQTVEAMRPEADLPRVGRDEPADGVEERGLAGAIGPDEAGDGAGCDVDGAPGERRHAAEALGDVDHREQRARGVMARILSEDAVLSSPLWPSPPRARVDFIGTGVLTCEA